MATQTPSTVTIFAGSLRSGSFNKQLVRALMDLAPQLFTWHELDMSDIPLFNEDVEAEGVPRPVQQFKAALAESDGTIIATPEYSHSIPGVLKNALDWASRAPDVVLRDKPVAICGASTGRFGTARGQEQVRQVLAAHGALAMPLPLLYITQAEDAFHKNGQLADERAVEAARRFLDGFAQFIHDHS